jgi:hypothetical protein
MKTFLLRLLWPTCATAYVCYGHVCYGLRVGFGQNPMYTVSIRYFWQGNHQIYGHIQCIYTVLANPTYVPNFTLLLYTRVHTKK